MKCAASAAPVMNHLRPRMIHLPPLLLGRGADHGRIGAAARRRLGHGEGGFDLALDDRPQPPFLLRRRADTRQQTHVAVVRRRAIDRQRPKQRARRFLVDRRPGDDRQRHAAEFLGRLRRPQPGFLRLLLNRREPGERNILVLGEILRLGFERQHVRLDEGARSQPQLLDFGRKSKVHAGVPPVDFYQGRNTWIVQEYFRDRLKCYIEAGGGMESQGEAMKRMAWAIAGAAALLLLKIPPSQALVGDAPWCAVVDIGNGEVEWDCQYQTIEPACRTCSPAIAAFAIITRIMFPTPLCRRTSNTTRTATLIAPRITSRTRLERCGRHSDFRPSRPENGQTRALLRQNDNATMS